MIKPTRARARRIKREVAKFSKLASKPGQTKSSYYRILKRRFRDWLKRQKKKELNLKEKDRDDDIIDAVDERNDSSK